MLRTRVKTLSSGRRVRQTLRRGRIVESKTLPARKKTKSRTRLAKARRRIGL